MKTYTSQFMQLPSRRVLAFLALSSLCASLNATTISWDFEDVNTPREIGIVTGDNAAFFSASNAVLGSGVDGTSEAGFSGATDSSFYAVFNTPGSEVLAADGDYYIEYSFSVDSGYTFNVDSLSFLVGASTGSQPSADGAFNTSHFLRADAEGVDYTTTLGSGSIYHAGTASTVLWANEPVLIDTSSNPDFSGLTSLTFRIYQFDDYESQFNSAWGRVDNVIASITIIPEPATATLLLALAACGCGLGRRSHRVG